MIRISDDAVWRAAEPVVKRIIEEVSDALKESERPPSWLPSPSTATDISDLATAPFRRFQDACADAFDFLWLAGPRRFSSTDEFIDVVFEMSRLRLLLDLDPRAPVSGEAAPRPVTEFVLSNAAAVLRLHRPSLALIVMEARPSKGGLVTVHRLQPAERQTVAAILHDLTATRFSTAPPGAAPWPDVVATSEEVASILAR